MKFCSVIVEICDIKVGEIKFPMGSPYKKFVLYRKHGILWYQLLSRDYGSFHEFLRAVSLKELVLGKVYKLKTNLPSVFLVEYISGGS